MRAKLAYLAYQLEVQDTSAKRENVKAVGGRKFYEVATAFTRTARILDLRRGHLTAGFVL